MTRYRSANSREFVAKQVCPGVRVISEKVRLPYGTGEIQADLPRSNLIGVAESKDLPALAKPDEAIVEALEHPLNSRRLADIAKKGSKVVIATSDIMRPGNYRRLILPHVLNQLRTSGVRERDITILDAVGSHQMNTKEDWVSLYGDNIFGKYKVINNNCRDTASSVDLGKSDLGDSVVVNRLLVESDLCVGVGAVQAACPTCGYDGGIKIFAIGAASIQTVFETHRAKNYWHPTARSGVVTGNKFREHIESVGEKILKECKADFFTIDAVTNIRTEMIGVFAGDAAEVYKKGCVLADRQWKVRVPRAADILIAAVSHPQASNPYEMNISMAMPIRYPDDILKPGGVFIFVGICDSPPAEGSASAEFVRLMRSFHEAADILDEVTRHQENEESEQPTLTNFLLHTRAYGTALTLKNCREVLIAGPKLPGLVRDIHFTPVSTLEKALERAMKTMGRNAEILVIPQTRACVAHIR
jgi:nickel-dependent lactate racemase